MRDTLSVAPASVAGSGSYLKSVHAAAIHAVATTTQEQDMTATMNTRRMRRVADHLLVSALRRIGLDSALLIVLEILS
jgi:hypothetical protein